MASIKTAISIQETLFEQADALARELQISRSRLFVLAVEDFIQRHQNQQLFEAINAAYDDSPDPEEQALRHKMRGRHRQLMEGQW
jgi:metal-responsive CopG/Arc/MetJ family transcriptional regulator